MKFNQVEFLAKRNELKSLVDTANIPKISDITDLILIVGSSRSGSSSLHKILSSHPQINALSGEDSTYSKIFSGCEVNLANINDSLAHSHNSIRNGMELLISEVGRSSDEKINAHDWLMRFSLQWPLFFLKTSNEELLKLASNFLSYENFLSQFDIDLNLYENNTNSSEFKPEIIIEDLPFIFPSKRIFQKENRNILLLKASSNVYRLKEIEQIFSKAKIHYLYTNRNPEECINGLYDGWKSNGFHSYKITNTELNITEYDSKNWWKFDLPPGWNDYSQSHLLEVCRFQWKSANQYALNHLKKRKFFTLKYQQLFSPNDLFKNLNTFLKHLDLVPLKPETTIPRAMTTELPQLDRWKKRESEILKFTKELETQGLKKEIMELPFENN
jgi:hypothetical protein